MRMALSAAIAALLLVPAPAHAADCSTRTTSCGTTVTGTITGDTCIVDFFPTQKYTFSGKAGQSVEATVTSLDGYNSQIAIQSSSGAQLAYGCCDDPSFAKTTLPSDGTYTLAVSFGDPHRSGQFRLALTCTDPTTPPPSGCPYVGTVTVRVPINASLGPSNGTGCFGPTTYGAKYSVNGTKDVPLQITLTSSAFKPYLDVETTDGTNGVFRVATAPGSVTVTFLPETTGPFRIFVAANSSSPVSGAYTLRVDPAAVDACRRRAITH
jgi:hypothetical protein